MDTRNIVCMLVITTIFYSAHGYKGKVFDSTPKVRDDPLLTMEVNLNEYLHRIEDQDDIVVFPEYGLTSLDVFSKENLTKYGLEIPAVDASVSICKQETKSKIISLLSCTAAEKSIYLVANIIEAEKKFFFNTNLVFNKQGALIAKYRKINLFGDEKTYFKPGDQLVTFDTGFGTFGIFTCLDILYKRPALDILVQDNVTNIVYPTSWFSKTPFWASLSVQDGYAKRTGVNLLASAYNAPKNANGGAGIYQGRQEKSVHIQGISGTAAVVSEIGRTIKGRPQCTMMDTGDKDADTRGILNNDIAKLFKMENSFEQNAKSFQHVALSLDAKSFEEKLCTSDQKLCCRFTAKIFNTLVESLRYKFVLYSKDQDYACGMVSCATDDITSCGKPMPESKENNFVLLRIEANHKNLEAYDIPSTLAYNLKPVDSYKYCSSPGNVTVELENKHSIVTFGMLISAASNMHAMIFTVFVSLVISRIF